MPGARAHGGAAGRRSRARGRNRHRHGGLHPGRSYFSAEPWERFDGDTGNLSLVFTDITLPGNGGRALRVQRTYSTLFNPGWQLAIAGLPALVVQAGLPIGTAVDGQTHQWLATGGPQVMMADGGTR